MWTLRRILILIVMVSSVAVIGTLVWVTATYQRFAIDTQNEATASLVTFLAKQRIEKQHLQKVAPFIDEWSRLSTLVHGMQENAPDKAKIAANRMMHTLEVAEGRVRLRNVVVYDRNLNVFAEADGGTRESLLTRPAIFEPLKRRDIRQQRQSMAFLWRTHEDRPVHSTIAPIGGFRVVGFIEFVTDPIPELAGVGEAFGGTFRLLDVHDNVLFEGRADDTDDGKADNRPLSSGAERADIHLDTLRVTIPDASGQPWAIATLTRDTTAFKAAVDMLRDKAIWIVALVVSGSIMLGWLLLRLAVFGRLRAFASAMETLAQGDTTVDIPITGPDEFQTMRTAMQDLRTAVEERARAEEELERQRDILEATLEHLDQGITLFDENLKLIVRNDKIVTLLGFPPEICRPGSMLETWFRFNAERGEYGPGDPEAQVRERMQLARRFEAHKFERQRPDGTVLEVRGNPVPGRGFVTSYSDITEMKKAEVALTRARDEAERHARAKSDFVAMVSHEVRTPMNGVLGMARLLIDTKLDAEQRECLETIIKSAQSLLLIVDDLLDISKLEAGRLELESIPFLVVDTIEQSVAVLEPRAAEKRLEIVFDIDPKVPPVVKGDPHRLRQVLINLVSNAVKFTSQGAITVSVRRISDDEDVAALRFAVADTGRGIRPETQAKLFQPFNQGTVEIARKYGGTGLGLAICRQLVQAMGGEIELSSKVGEGSTFAFTVDLPVDADTDPAALRNATASPKAAPHADADKKVKLRILQVEDNDTNRDVAERMLKRVGHEVVSVVNGRDALDILRTERFDVVLMDRHMPVMDGTEATRRIRALEEPLRSIPIVGITAGAMEDEIKACIDSGMNAVLTKPVAGEELRGTLIRMTQAAREWTPLASEKPVLVVDDVQVNLKVAQKQLTKLGLPCRTVDDPRRALDMLKTGDYALAIVDIKMPNMDGVELTMRLRAWEKDRGTHTPVVAMTGLVSADEKNRFAAAGMDGYLAKPVVLGDMAAMLAKWLSAPGDGTGGSKPKREERMNAKDTSSAPIDLALLGEILGEDDEAEKIDWVGNFVDQFPPFLDELDAAVAGENRKAARDAAHAAKSAASSAAAVALTAVLQQLETAATSDAWASIAAVSGNARSEFARVVAFVDGARRKG